MLEDFSLAPLSRVRHRGPLVLVVKTVDGSQLLAHSFPVLAEVPFSNAEGSYAALGWQARAGRGSKICRLATMQAYLQVGPHRDGPADMCSLICPCLSK